jgi:GNAT superfamily N-acetyltransferase
VTDSPAGRPAGALEHAAAANLAVHMSWVQRRTPGMRVDDAPDLLLVDCGLPTDTFSYVARARIAPARLDARVREALEWFRRVGRPFSWWVGPGDEPDGLGDALEAAGLAPAESELAMAADLAPLAPPPAPEGLRIERVRTLEDVEAFARILAANWSPPDEAVVAFYRAAAPALLTPESPLRLYLARRDGVPVATAELAIGGGVAGLYNIATLEPHRRQGIGTAVTAAPLLDARRAGVRTGVLQAAPDGVGVYERLGFRATGRYTEYQPRR